MVDNKGDDVSFVTAKQRKMLEPVSMLRGVMGGTKSMRDNCQEVLPMYPAERPSDYQGRVKRSVFTNYFSMTVKHLVGKAFSKPLVFNPDVPKEIRAWAEDIDLQGTHLNDFAANVFTEALSVGFTSIFVDYPKILNVSTLAEERALNARPYMTMIPLENLLGVRTMGNAAKLTQARILEITMEPNGRFGEKECRRIRVLYPGSYELYEFSSGRDNDTPQYSLVESGSVSPMKRVPLVPIYGVKVAAWLGEAPLVDLAYKNIQHFQVDSDIGNALRVASFPILAASGFDQDDDAVIKLAPNVVLTTKAETGKFYYVEHTGTAIGVGRQRLEDLKADMATMGLQLMMSNQGGGEAPTASETLIKYSESTSHLQRMAFGLKDGIENAMLLVAEWAGLKEGGSIELKGQYTLPKDVASEVQALISLRNAREITSKTLLEELKRRDFLPEDFDIDDEIALMELEKEDPMNAFPNVPNVPMVPKNPVTKKDKETPKKEEK